MLRTTILAMYHDGFLTKSQAGQAWSLAKIIGEESPEALDQVLETMGLDGYVAYDYWQ